MSALAGALLVLGASGAATAAPVTHVRVAPAVEDVEADTAIPEEGSVSSDIHAQPESSGDGPLAVANLPVVTNMFVSGPDDQGRWILNGEGVAGATIHVADGNRVLIPTMTPTVDANGKWQAAVPLGTPTPLWIWQSQPGSASEIVSFEEAPLPMVNGYVLAGVAGFAGLVGIAVYAVRRRGRVSLASV